MIVSLLSVLFVYAGHVLFLRGAGEFLVVSDPLNKADAIVVLNGDSERDERLLYAVELWQKGYARKVIISAHKVAWQSDEDISEWRHALKLNIIPKESLVLAINEADSTREEARMLLPFVIKQGFKSVIIVTSNYHTRRSKKVFQKEWNGSGIQTTVSAAPFYQFHPDDWWKHRSDSRTFFFEFSKTLWSALKKE